MWEWVGNRTELKHIDPHSIGHNCVSFPFSWAAQPGPGGPASLGHVLIPASSLQLVWSPNWLIGGLTAPSAGCRFSFRVLSPTGLVFKLTDFLYSPIYVIVHRPPSCGRHNRTHSTRLRSRLYSDIPWADAPVIYIGAFPTLTARPGRWSIYNIWLTLVWLSFMAY